MRLLWLKSECITSPDTSGATSSCNLMRGLSKFYSLTYIALRSASEASQDSELSKCAEKVITFSCPEEIKEGAGYYFRVLVGMFSSLPYVFRKYSSAEIRALQAEFCAQSAETTVILCESLEMAENVDFRTPAPKVLFLLKIETTIWMGYFKSEKSPLRKAYFNFETKRMAEYEKKTCHNFDLILVVSEDQKRLLQDEFKVTTPIEILDSHLGTENCSEEEAAERIHQLLLSLTDKPTPHSP